MGISYQIFCWVIGTTSFRTAKLNLKIEKQLLLLNKFHKKICKNAIWCWNSDLQTDYYDFMKSEKFLKGNAKRKDKDAREKTSGLVNIGLITSDRLVTDAGKELLSVSSEGLFEKDPIFDISADSFVYLKQLLKTSIKVGGKDVRPYIVLLKCLSELDYLSYGEFTYLLPMIVDKNSASKIIQNIKKYREGEVDFEDIIYEKLISMDNYQVAEQLFLCSDVSEDLICDIGINRKSRIYDKPYYELYLALKAVFIDGDEEVINLLNIFRKLKYKVRKLWRNLIFRSDNANLVRKNGRLCTADSCPFRNLDNEKEFKKMFFKYLHVYKAMATLEDYFDLNRRYFSLTETIIFEDRIIRLDVFPKYYFKSIINELFGEAFIKCCLVNDSVSLEEISHACTVDLEYIYEKLGADLNIAINTSEQAKAYIMDERYKRFNRLIDERFDNTVLVELLECFEKRYDKRIEELVTDEATIPTIFEYVLGIIWYKVSERQGNILEFMKLSLDANLLPKTHATGGYADIVYEYGACLPHYPKHTLLIEATLADGTNQRRMEMEPVSRHLGDYRIKYDNSFDYSLFASTYLDKNVVSDFRHRKRMPYIRNDKKISGMKIISIDTNVIKKIIENETKYSYLYDVFDRYHKMPLEKTDWYDVFDRYHKMPLEKTDWYDDMVSEVIKGV